MISKCDQEIDNIETDKIIILKNEEILNYEFNAKQSTLSSSKMD